MSHSIDHRPTRFIDRIDHLLRRAEERLERGADGFHAATLSEFLDAAGAAAVALWRVDAAGVSALADAGDASLSPPLAESVGNLSGEVRSEADKKDPQRRVWSVAETIDDRSGVLLSVIAPADIPATEFEEVLAALARLHADFERRVRVRLLNLQIDRQNQLLGLLGQMHTSRRISDVCTIVATDGAQLMGVDRVSVVLFEGDGARLISATGVPDPERRADATRAIEHLALSRKRADANLEWTARDEAEIAESDPAAVVQMETSGSTAVRVVLFEGDVCGALIMEQFGTPPPALDLACGLAPQCGAALANIEARDGGLWRRVRQFRRFAFGNGRRILVAVACVVLALSIIPARFEVEALGTLQPVRRRDVFAPEDGVIRRVVAEDSQHVARGDELLELSSPELELQRERIRGELHAARSRLAGFEASRGGIDPVTGLSVTAAAEETRNRIASLERQLELLDGQFSSLTVRAPISGLVFHGDLSRSLAGRPVRQGQHLLQMADPASEWEVLLRIPDGVVRHVLAARGDEQTVSFVLRTAPGQRYAGRLVWIGLSTEVDEMGDLSTPARVSLTEIGGTRLNRDDLRPGVGVVARIDCGRRSIGYVWFHDLIDGLRRRLFF